MLCALPAHSLLFGTDLCIFSPRWCRRRRRWSFVFVVDLFALFFYVAAVNARDLRVSVQVCMYVRTREQLTWANRMWVCVSPISMYLTTTKSRGPKMSRSRKSNWENTGKTLLWNHSQRPKPTKIMFSNLNTRSGFQDVRRRKIYVSSIFVDLKIRSPKVERGGGEQLKSMCACMCVSIRDRWKYGADYWERRYVIVVVGGGSGDGGHRCGYRHRHRCCNLKSKCAVRHQIEIQWFGDCAIASHNTQYIYKRKMWCVCACTYLTVLYLALSLSSLVFNQIDWDFSARVCWTLTLTGSV